MRDSASRGINQGFTQIRPSDLPLACCARMERAPLGFAPSFAPRDYSQRTSRWGQAIEHEPETRSTSSTQPPILRVHSNACDLASHATLQKSAEPGRCCWCSIVAEASEYRFESAEFGGKEQAGGYVGMGTPIVS